MAPAPEPSIGHRLQQAVVVRADRFAAFGDALLNGSALVVSGRAGRRLGVAAASGDHVPAVGSPPFG